MPKRRCFFTHKLVRHLDQNARAVAGQRVRAHSAAMRQITQNFQALR